MIKKMWVDNYKALNEFEISFTPFTLIIGNNAVGKSSVMEVVDFLAGSVKESFDIILERRQQTVQNILSKLKESSRILLGCVVELEIEKKKKCLKWELQIKVDSQKNFMMLEKEQVTCEDYIYLTFEYGQGGFLKGKKEIEVPALSYKMSILNLIDAEKDRDYFPELSLFKKFWERSAFFEMLLPERMRLSRKEETDTIGRAGDKLPSFIQSMTAKRLKAYQEKFSEFFSKKQDSISAKTLDDYTIMEIVENYGEKKVGITSLELSDGMLRLLALLAVSEMDQKYALLMADEIENGINAGYSEKLMYFLKKACTEKKQQFIMTTHSTVFLDYANADDIIYLFRDQKTGGTKAVQLFEVPAFKERLKNFYPGEILLNLSSEEILVEMKIQK